MQRSWLMYTHCNTLQNVATCCNILQHSATRCNTLKHTLHHAATRCNTTLQHSSPKHKTQTSHAKGLAHVYKSELSESHGVCNSSIISVSERVAVRCTVLQCTVLQCTVMCCSVLPCIQERIVWRPWRLQQCDHGCAAVCYNVLQCAAVRCNVLQCVAVYSRAQSHSASNSAIHRCITMYGSVLQCDAVCCSVCSIPSWNVLGSFGMFVHLHCPRLQPYHPAA